MQNAQDMARQGFKYLEVVALRGNVLGLLLYGLAAEAGRGTSPDIMLAHQARLSVPLAPLSLHRLSCVSTSDSKWQGPLAGAPPRAPASEAQ